MEVSEFKRTPGFSDADGGSNNVQYKNPNEAFKAYLKATGQAPTKENKAKFKQWLAHAKQSGKFEQVIKSAAAIKESVESHADGDDKKSTETVKVTVKEEVKKDTRILGMKPMVAAIAAVAAISLISYGIYYVVKKNKAKAA